MTAIMAQIAIVTATKTVIQTLLSFLPDPLTDYRMNIHSQQEAAHYLRIPSQQASMLLTIRSSSRLMKPRI